MPLKGQILRINDPRFREFADKLQGPEGINVKVTGKGEDYHWTCFHDHRFTRKIVAEMGYDPDRTVEYLEAAGGRCDCTVIMNVVATLPE